MFKEHKILQINKWNKEELTKPTIKIKSLTWKLWLYKATCFPVVFQEHVIYQEEKNQKFKFCDTHISN